MPSRSLFPVISRKSTPSTEDVNAIYRIFNGYYSGTKGVGMSIKFTSFDGKLDNGLLDVIGYALEVRNREQIAEKTFVLRRWDNAPFVTGEKGLFKAVDPDSLTPTTPLQVIVRGTPAGGVLAGYYPNPAFSDPESHTIQPAMIVAWYGNYTKTSRTDHFSGTNPEVTDAPGWVFCDSATAAISGGVRLRSGAFMVVPNMTDRFPVGAGGSISYRSSFGQTLASHLAGTNLSHTHPHKHVHQHAPGSYTVADHQHGAGTYAVADHQHGAGSYSVADHQHNSGTYAVVDHQHGPGTYVIPNHLHSTSHTHASGTYFTTSHTHVVPAHNHDLIGSSGTSAVSITVTVGNHKHNVQINTGSVNPTTHTHGASAYLVTGHTATDTAHHHDLLNASTDSTAALSGQSDVTTAASNSFINAIGPAGNGKTDDATNADLGPSGSGTLSGHTDNVVAGTSGAESTNTLGGSSQTVNASGTDGGGGGLGGSSAVLGANQSVIGASAVLGGPQSVSGTSSLLGAPQPVSGTSALLGSTQAVSGTSGNDNETNDTTGVSGSPNSTPPGLGWWWIMKL